MEKFELKQQEEMQYMHYFKRAYPEFPKGLIIKQESPDFVLKLSKHYSIGIELTKLFFQQKEDDKSYFVPLFEEEKQRLIQKVKQIFLERHRMQVSAHFKFTDKYYDVNVNLNLLAIEIADRISEETVHRSKHKHFSIKIKGKRLPEWLKSVLIIHDPEDKVSTWISCKVKIPRENYYNSLQHSIARKEEKLMFYEKNWCDKYWLLIVAECFSCAAPFNVHNFLEHIRIDSSFHKVFLFEIFKKRVHQLV